MSRYPKRPEYLHALRSQLAESGVSAIDAMEIGFLGAPTKSLPILMRLRLRQLAHEHAKSNPLVFLHLLGVSRQSATNALTEFEERSARWIKGLSRKRLQTLTRHLAGAVAQSRDVEPRHQRFVAALAFARHRLTATKAGARWGYRTFYLRKASGKYRRIDAPSPPLKRLLRRTLAATEARVLKRFRQAGVGGCIRSPVLHAMRHVGSDVMVSFDLKDFYPSTTRRAVLEGFRCLALAKRGSRITGYQDELSDALVTALGTRCGVLPQGSPTSALLADVAFFPFERRIRRKLGELQKKHGVVIRYSRYADDIVVSYFKPATQPGDGGAVASLQDAEARLERLRAARADAASERDALTQSLEQCDGLEYEWLVSSLEELTHRESELASLEEATSRALERRNAAAHASPADPPRVVKEPPTHTRFRKEVEQILGTVFRGSPYQINETKTTSGTSTKGFEITGLLLRLDRSTGLHHEACLARGMREELRGHLHAIETKGLLAAAARWRAHRAEEKPKVARARVHRSKRAHAERKRLAAVISDHLGLDDMELPVVDPMQQARLGLDAAPAVSNTFSAREALRKLMWYEARYPGLREPAQMLIDLIGELRELDAEVLAAAKASGLRIVDLGRFIEYLNGMHAHVGYIATWPWASPRLKDIAARLASAVGRTRTN